MRLNFFRTTKSIQMPCIFLHACCKAKSLHVGRNLCVYQVSEFLGSWFGYSSLRKVGPSCSQTKRELPLRLKATFLLPSLYSSILSYRAKKTRLSTIGLSNFSWKNLNNYKLLYTAIDSQVFWYSNRFQIGWTKSDKLDFKHTSNSS